MELRQKHLNENLKFEDFKDKHVGKTVYIVGTGASLRDFDWNKIRDQYTISYNKSVFHIPFWTDYYWIWDRNGNEENIYNLMDFAPLPKFSKYKWIRVKRLPVGDNRLFGPEGLRRAGSSAIYATELALWMGFEKIVLLGQDLYVDRWYSYWQKVETPSHFKANKQKWFGRELINEFRRFEGLKNRVFVGHSPRSLLVRQNVLPHLDI